jgi:hypothetical protein
MPRPPAPPEAFASSAPPPAPAPSANASPSGNGGASDAPAAVDAAAIRQRVGDEVVVFRRRTAGPSRFVLRECFE